MLTHLARTPLLCVLAGCEKSFNATALRLTNCSKPSASQHTTDMFTLFLVVVSFKDIVRPLGAVRFNGQANRPFPPRALHRSSRVG